MSLNITNIAICLLFLFNLISIVILIIYVDKVNKLKKMYDKALAKFNSCENVNDEFNSIYNRLNVVESVVKNTVDIVNSFSEKNKSNVKKIGFIKYNAYDETDNKLSFSLALLDEREDGILINHVYSKHGSNTYAKLVKQGKVEDRISEEEAVALKIAHEDKEFKIREGAIVEKTSIKKIRK